jgi:hypothetical protein
MFLAALAHGTSKTEEKKKDMGTPLSKAAFIKLGTRPSPPPLPKTYSIREPTPTQTTHNAQHTGVKQNSIFFAQKGTKPSQASSGRHITPDPTQNRCGKCLFASGE